jgi:hypothetical protein
MAKKIVMECWADSNVRYHRTREFPYEEFFDEDYELDPYDERFLDVQTEEWAHRDISYTWKIVNE